MTTDGPQGPKPWKCPGVLSLSPVSRAGPPHPLPEDTGQGRGGVWRLQSPPAHEALVGLGGHLSSCARGSSCSPAPGAVGRGLMVHLRLSCDPVSSVSPSDQCKVASPVHRRCRQRGGRREGQTGRGAAPAPRTKLPHRPPPLRYTITLLLPLPPPPAPALSSIPNQVSGDPLLP